MILLTAALAGCASQNQAPRILTKAEAMTFSDAALCYGSSVYGPTSAAVARDEIRSRGVNCQDHAAAVGQMLQQRAEANARAASDEEAQRALALQMLQSGAFQVKPNTIDPNLLPALRPQTTCTTERIGNQLQTVCR